MNLCVAGANSLSQGRSSSIHPFSNRCLWSADVDQAMCSGQTRKLTHLVPLLSPQPWTAFWWICPGLGRLRRLGLCDKLRSLSAAFSESGLQETELVPQAFCLSNPSWAFLDS